MKKEIAEKWIAELRSGKYEQGKEYLNKDNKLCCLGVLCEIAVKEDVCERSTNHQMNIVSYDEVDNILPESVMAWAEIKQDEGKYGHSELLTQDNDDYSKTFPEIADIIEGNIDNL